MLKKNLLIQKDRCISMFMAALFITAKTKKQPKCLSTEEWIKKMWYIYKMEYYSAIKKYEIMPFATTCMDQEMIILSEKRSVQFSCSVMSDSFQPHEPQNSRPPCPSPIPRVHPNPCPLSW